MDRVKLSFLDKIQTFTLLSIENCLDKGITLPTCFCVVNGKTRSNAHQYSSQIRHYYNKYIRPTFELDVCTDADIVIPTHPNTFIPS